MKKNYIKIDKINGEKKRITKLEALRLMENTFDNPDKILNNSTLENPINLCFSMIYKGVA